MEGKSDAHGRIRPDTLASSVVSSWASQLFTIAAGFVLPRLVDQEIGQEALGVWDLAWSVVAQFKLVQAGFGSSVNRFVASYLARRDISGVNRVVSSANVVSTGMALLVLLLTASAFFDPLGLYKHRFGVAGEQLGWLVLILGITVAVQIEASALNGIVTGCQKWAAHNAINAASAAGTFIASLISLYLGYGLVALAAIHLAGEVGGRLAHWRLAFKVCPGLSLSWTHSDRPMMGEMLVFGFKTFLVVGGAVLRHGVTGIIIAIHLGPASLAIFSRPRALVSRVNTFLQKYAFVFVPAVSALQAQGKGDEIRALAVVAVRGSVAICMPTLLLIGIMGGELLEIWMGGNYRYPALIAVITLTYGCDIVYAPLYRILTALNQHGWVSVVSFLASLIAIAAAYGYILLGAPSLLGVAVWSGVPTLMWNMVVLPTLACRVMEMPLLSFMSRVWCRPLLCCAPYAVCLYLSHVYFGETPGKAVIIGFCIGGALLGASYWYCLVPEVWRAQLTSKVRKWLRFDFTAFPVK